MMLKLAEIFFYCLLFFSQDFALLNNSDERLYLHSKHHSGQLIAFSGRNISLLPFSTDLISTHTADFDNQHQPLFRLFAECPTKKLRVLASYEPPFITHVFKRSLIAQAYVQDDEEQPSRPSLS
ncbi:MAG: hypothetical protein WBA74_20515 [Cyclobacteriaceae bacterium]